MLSQQTSYQRQTSLSTINDNLPTIRSKFCASAKTPSCSYASQSRGKRSKRKSSVAEEPWVLKVSCTGPPPKKVAVYTPDIPFAVGKAMVPTQRQAGIFRLLASIGCNFFVEVMQRGAASLFIHDPDLDLVTAFDIVCTDRGITVDQSVCPYLPDLKELVRYLATIEGRAELACNLSLPRDNAAPAHVRLVRDSIRALFKQPGRAHRQLNRITSL